MFSEDEFVFPHTPDRHFSRFQHVCIYILLTCPENIRIGWFQKTNGGSMNFLHDDLRRKMSNLYIKCTGHYCKYFFFGFFVLSD